MTTQELKTGLLPAPRGPRGAWRQTGTCCGPPAGEPGHSVTSSRGSFLGVPTGLSPSLLPSLNTRISYFLRLEGGREPYRMLINMPASLPLALCRGNFASPLCQYIYYRETTGDHVIKFQSFESILPELPRRVPCLPSSEQPLSRLARSHLVPPVWRLLTTGQEVLLCLLNAPSFSAVIDFKMPLLPLPGSTGRGSGVLAVSRGRGQIPPEVRSCKRGNRPQACPHRLCHSLTPGRPILVQSHTAVAVSASPGC